MKGLHNGPLTPPKVHETGLCLVGATSARAIAWGVHTSQRKVHMYRQSSKLANVLYDIR